jgi:type IV pilus assembly protein PilP
MITTVQWIRISCMTGLTALMLVGCTGQQDDLDRYLAEVKARPAAPIAPIPTVRTYTPYEYDGLAGRDPFRMSTTEGSDEVPAGNVGTGPRPDLQRTREYLERFDLDTLMMVGTFAKGSSEGNYMGKNHGKVNMIAPDEVVLSEFIADGAGGWLVRDASIALGGK